MVRSLAMAIAVTSCLGCSPRDPHQLDAVRAAAIAVREELSTGGGDSPRLTETIRALQSATATAGSAARPYAAATEICGYLLRFRNLESDGPGDTQLLRGANRPIALRYGIPFEERGGGRWISRKAAVNIFSAKAASELTAAISAAGPPAP